MTPRNPSSAGSIEFSNPPHNTSTRNVGETVGNAPLKTHRRARLRLGPIRIDFFVTGRPWWLPLDRR